MSQQVVVLGMHRSGTSLVALVLQELGVFMGCSLLGANENNPFGYAEDIEFLEINECILKAAGGSWDSVPSKEKLKQSFKQYLNQLSLLVSQRNGQYDLWGWKDPRTSVLFGFYKYLLPDAKIICIQRDSLSVAKSLRRRSRMPLPKGLELCAEYQSRLNQELSTVESRRVLKINFYDLIDQKGEVIRDIASFLQIQMDDKMYYKAVSVIKTQDILKKTRNKMRTAKRMAQVKTAVLHPLTTLSYLGRRCLQINR